MSDLIDRRELINQINDDAENFIGHPTAVALHNAMVEYALDLIKEAPAVEAEPVRHGRWNSITNCSNAGVYCSVCGKKVWKEDYAWCNRKNKLRSDYCPHCGAIMDGDDYEDYSE